MNPHATPDTAITPPVAVIILNWNGSKLLEEYLPKVMATTDPAIGRVIVADNGSTDGSVGMLASRFPEVGVMRFDRNYGFAEGYNKAIAGAADYRYVVLLNSDVATTGGWLNALYSFMEEHPDTGACQPKLRSVTAPDCFEYAGAAGGFLDKNGYPYCRGRIFGTCETDSGQYDSPMEIFWASGACLMIRRDLYLDAGGLDPLFFAHMEEIDLCWRVRLMGFKVMCVPRSVVCHLGGGSLPDSNPRKVYLNFRNNLLMLHKNLPDSVRRRRLTVRRLLDTVAWARYIASGKLSFAMAVLRAHRDFRRMRKAYTDHPSADLLRSDKYTSVNILVEYFLCGRRHFSALKP